MALDVDSKTFVVCVAMREQEEMSVHFKRQAQIEAQSRTQVGALLFDKASTEVPADYSDYNNAFSVKNIAEFLENTRINKYTIKLEKGK